MYVNHQSVFGQVVFLFLILTVNFVVDSFSFFADFDFLQHIYGNQQGLLEETSIYTQH